MLQPRGRGPAGLDDSLIVLAHGVGGRGDLPVPFSLALAGAVLVLVLSFVVLAFAWPAVRFGRADAGIALPAVLTRLVDSRAFRICLQVLGLVGAGYVVVAAVFGPDLLVNPTFGVVYVLLWVGVVPLSLLFGPVWRFVNPLRTLHALLARFVLRTPPEQGLLPLPPRLGYWPAAVGLFAFVWLELVAPGNTTLVVIRLWFAVYAVVQLMGAVVYGARWFDRGDPFEVYSALFGRLSPLGRRQSDRRLVLRNPLVGLGTLAPAPGLLAVVSVLLGSTGFDGFSSSPVWVRYVQAAPTPEIVTATGALTAFVLVVAVTLWLGTTSTRALTDPHTGHGLPGQFAASVIPIALGYVIAHYFTLLVLEGQRTLVLLSDPLANGANVFGLSGRDVDPWIAQDPGAVAAVKVGAVVAGHLVGVLAAHDKAVGLFPRGKAVLGQVPLFLVMIGYTLGGLTLLFAA
jgi:hypothetical protein